MRTANSSPMFVSFDARTTSSARPTATCINWSGLGPTLLAIVASNSHVGSERRVHEGKDYQVDDPSDEPSAQVDKAFQKLTRRQLGGCFAAGHKPLSITMVGTRVVTASSPACDDRH